MPNVLQTNILLGGKLLPNATSSFKAMTGYLTNLQTKARAVNSGFTGMTKSLVGLAGGLVAFRSVNELLKGSMDLAKEAKSNVSALTTSLSDWQKISVQQAQQQIKAIQKQSEELQQQTGLYSEIFNKGAATLANFGFSEKQIEKLNPLLTDLIVTQKQWGKSTEEINATYEAIGKSAKQGLAKSLAAVGIILSKQEKQWIQIHAGVNDTAENIAFIGRVIHAHFGGAAARRMADPFGAGRADLAMSNILAARARLGAPFLDIQKMGKILLGDVIPGAIDAFTPHIQWLTNLMKSHFSEWRKQLTQFLPIFKKMMDEGWNRLVVAFKWFQQNWGWIKEVVKYWLIWKGLVIAFGLALGPVLTGLRAIQATVALMTVINPFAPWILGAVALAGAIYLVYKNWTRIREFFVGNAYKSQLKYPLKGVKRAQPAFPSEGIFDAKTIADMNNAFGHLFNSEDWQWITKNEWKVVVDTSKAAVLWIAETVKEAIHDMTVMYQFLKDVINWVQDHTGKLMTNPQGQTPNSLDPYRPGGKLGPPAAAKSIIPRMIARPGVVPQRGLNLTHFGYPGDSTPDWDSSHGIGAYSPGIWSMKPGYSAALLKSDADLWGIKPGQTFSYQGKQYRRDDRIPARWKDKQGVWHTMSRGRIDVYDPAYREKTSSSNQSSGSRGDIHIHNNAVYHIHGDNSEHKIAAHHARHIDNMRRLLAEAEWQKNRQEFSG